MSQQYPQLTRDNFKSIFKQECNNYEYNCMDNPIAGVKAWIYLMLRHDRYRIDAVLKYDEQQSFFKIAQMEGLDEVKYALGGKTINASTYKQIGERIHGAPFLVVFADPKKGFRAITSIDVDRWGDKYPQSYNGEMVYSIPVDRLKPLSEILKK